MRGLLTISLLQLRTPIAVLFPAFRDQTISAAHRKFLFQRPTHGRARAASDSVVSPKARDFLKRKSKPWAMRMNPTVSTSLSPYWTESPWIRAARLAETCVRKTESHQTLTPIFFATVPICITLASSPETYNPRLNNPESILSL